MRSASQSNSRQLALNPFTQAKTRPATANTKAKTVVGKSLSIVTGRNNSLQSADAMYRINAANNNRCATRTGRGNPPIKHNGAHLLAEIHGNTFRSGGPRGGSQANNAVRLTGGTCQRTDFDAPVLDPGFDRVADEPGLFESGRFASFEARRIGKRPRQLDRHAGKDRAGSGFALRLAANSYDVGERDARFPDIEDFSGAFVGNIDPDLAHGFDRQRVYDARVQAAALRFKFVAADLIEPRFRHLAAKAVVYANEQDLFLLHAQQLVSCCRRSEGFRADFLAPLFYLGANLVSNLADLRQLL